MSTRLITTKIALPYILTIQSTPNTQLIIKEQIMDILNAALNINQSHENDVLARLTTVWGENLNPEHVLEEYPRPQLKRDNYTILNGYWNYAITRTPDIPEAYDGKILVPFSPESILSGVEKL